MITVGVAEKHPQDENFFLFECKHLVFESTVTRQ